MGGGLNATARGVCNHVAAQNLCRTQAICTGRVSRRCENVNDLKVTRKVNVRHHKPEKRTHTFEIEMTGKR